MKENSSGCTDTLKVSRYERPTLYSIKTPPPPSTTLFIVCKNTYFTLPININPPIGYNIAKIEWQYDSSYQAFASKIPYNNYPLPTGLDTFFVVPSDIPYKISHKGTFRCRVTNDKGCYTYYQWDVSVYGAYAGKPKDLTLCGSNLKTIDLNKQLSEQDIGGQWALKSSNFPKNKFDKKGIINIDSIPFGIYKFAYIVSSVTNTCFDTAFVRVNINPELKIDAGKDQILTCKDSVLTLGTTQNIQNQVIKTWINLENTGSIFPDTALLKIGQEGRYVLTIKHKTNGCTISDTVLVKDQRMKNIFSYEPIKCGAKYGSAKVELVHNGILPITYTIDNQILSSNIFNQLTEGKHKIIVSDAGSCQDTFSFILTKPLDIKVTLFPKDTTIDTGDTLLLQLFFFSNTINNVKEMTWFKDGALFDKKISIQKSIKPLQNSNYQVVVESKDGCKDSASANIKVIKGVDLFAPTVFSPNNDQNNDIFKLYPNPKKVNKILYFDIYDRWGNHILHQENIDANSSNFGWDGTYRGEVMEQSTYLWSAEISFFNGISKKLLGDVNLLR